jgi:hypothetical protein
MAGTTTRKLDRTLSVNEEPGLDAPDNTMVEPSETQVVNVDAANHDAPMNTAEIVVDVDAEPEIEGNLDQERRPTYDDTAFEQELQRAVITQVTLTLPSVYGGRRLVQLQHKAGCPANPGRVESYPVRSPQGRRAITVRCVDCAEQKMARLTT